MPHWENRHNFLYLLSIFLHEYEWKQLAHGVGDVVSVGHVPTQGFS